LKRQIVLAGFTAGEGHIASALSILDILWVLYDQVLRYDSKDPRNDSRDRFILSKGHGSLALYAVLADKGFFPTSALESFASFCSPLGGHPDCHKIPGVEASTGSLGHGLPMGVGVALALRIRDIHQRVIVLVGDGECNEGSIWESVLLAAHYRLSNLCCVVDYNHSTDRALLLGDIAAKFTAFGWNAINVNGHDHEAIHRGLIRGESYRPTVIVAETIKGSGCKIMENNPAWHHRVPGKGEILSILETLA
jgi:transketolase